MIKLILSTLLSLNIFAISVASAACTPEMVQDTYKNWLSAVNQSDASAVNKFYTDDAMTFFAYSPSLINDKEKRLQYLQQLFARHAGFKVTSEQVLETYPINSSSGVSAAIYTLTASPKDGKTQTLRLRTTFVYQETQHACKWVAQHTSLIPDAV